VYMVHDWVMVSDSELIKSDLVPQLQEPLAVKGMRSGGCSIGGALAYITASVDNMAQTGGRTGK